MAPGASPDGRVARKRPARPRVRPRTVALGGACSCAALPAVVDGTADAKALRTALVARMDALNQSMREHMAKIDATIVEETTDRIAQPAPLHKARRQLACGLDCLLRLFPGASPALWSYLDVAALFLDTARRAVGRLEAEVAKRPKGPTLAQLTRLFNRTARTSNESIGLALLVRATPAPQVGVDASSFKAKTRRWREGLRELLGAFRRRWMPLVQRLKPTGPALTEGVRLRVALARLNQGLGRLEGQARTIACKRGAGCAKPQATWDATQRNLAALRTRLTSLAASLRKANPMATVAEGRRLSQATDKAMEALLKAALSL